MDDIYDENLISSDEYSEDDDDEDDALMNDAATSVQNNNYTSKSENEQRLKQLKSLMRRKKISLIYKNKAIKWLNSKNKRQHVSKTIQLYLNSSMQKTSSNYEIQRDREKNKDIDTECVAESTSQKQVDLDEDSDVEHIPDDDDDVEINEMPVKAEPSKVVEEMVVQKEDTKVSIANSTNKRLRSASPNEKSTSLVENDTQAEKKPKLDGPQFYKKINEMFPTYNEMLTKEQIGNSATVQAIDDKIRCILTEIDTLDSILQTKELEWNRLIHLKIVKEEICTRLSRKREIIKYQESILPKCQGKILLNELKELELYFSEKIPNHQTNNANNQQFSNLESTSSIHQLIEKRANMKTEDLQREKSNTSRLENLLISQNMLNSIEPSSPQFLRNKFYNSNPFLNKYKQDEEYLEKRNMKSLDHLPLDANIDNLIKKKSFYSHHPLLEQFSSPQPHQELTNPCKAQQLQTFYNKHANLSLENQLSSPVTSTNNKLKQFQMQTKSLICSEDKLRKDNNTYMLKDGATKLGYINKLYPSCQECKIRESRFVCAGCGNQWYCSRACQMSAWDKHSEICVE